MENNYTVYLHLNKINGKRYYGITSLKVEYRWNNGKGYKEQYFARAINKYGWDNFEHIIIAKGLTKDDAGWIETVLIAEYDTTNPDKGYNITKGGEGTKGVNPRDYMTEEELLERDRKASESMKGKYCGENHPMYGKNSWDYMTEEAKKERRRKASASMKGKNHWENMTDEQKEECKRKLSESMKGKYCGENHPRVKSVITIINDKIFGVFDYAKQGAEYFGCVNSHISECCKGKRNYCGKYNGCKIVWRYIEIIEL